ncbi:MAG: hypothetical protein IV084_01455 [Rugosibacter sp.]|nr:hypothetical protein [Rugosibacter sp.]
MNNLHQPLGSPPRNHYKLFHLMRLALCFLTSTVSAYADESINVCFNFACNAQAPVTFSAVQLENVVQYLAAAKNPVEERELLAQTIGKLYHWAGEQTPVHADRAENFSDAGIPGAMDCIDHATTTTRFLHLLEKHHALHFHHVVAITRRGFIFQHFMATIEELPDSLNSGSSFKQKLLPDLSPQKTHPRRFAIDSWYVDNGQSARVVPLTN